MARKMSSGRSVSRPAQGRNSVNTPTARPAYAVEAGPRVVSRGTQSRPKPLAKWNPRTNPANATPRVVNHPQTIV